MNNPPKRPTRRSLLLPLAFAPLLATKLLAEAATEYSIVIKPATAMLGDSIVATLICAASHDGEVFTFEDDSLIVDLTRVPPAAEPELAFLNSRTEQRGSLQVRVRTVGRKRLRRGERLTRELQLITVFPRWMLDTGSFKIGYELGLERHPWRARSASVTIESGPAAIPRLFDLLDDPDEGVRARASGLLHRMTACFTAYGPNDSSDGRQEAIATWRQWWRVTGSKMPWNFVSSRATFDVRPAPPPPSRRSRFPGGVAYTRQMMDAASVSAMRAALAEWLRHPSNGLAALRGVRWVADLKFQYPSERVMLDPGDEVVTMLVSALSLKPGSARAALIIVATMARMPDDRFTESLSTLESLPDKDPDWHRPKLIAGGLLDFLDLGRNPTGGSSSPARK